MRGAEKVERARAMHARSSVLTSHLITPDSTTRSMPDRLVTSPEQPGARSVDFIPRLLKKNPQIDIVKSLDQLEEFTLSPERHSFKRRPGAKSNVSKLANLAHTQP